MLAPCWVSARGNAPLPKPLTGVTAVALSEGGGEAELCTKADSLTTRPGCAFPASCSIPGVEPAEGGTPIPSPLVPSSPHTCLAAMNTGRMMLCKIHLLSPQTQRR